MAEYDERNFEQMENDAINQMRQMHSRSTNTFMTKEEYKQAHSRQNGMKNSSENSRDELAHREQNTQHQPRVVSHQKNDGGIMSVLSSLFDGDTDKLLIMGLILILSKEKADQKLIMALLYILL